MPRGRRRAAPNVGALQEELDALKRRQAELRQQIRRLKNTQGEVSKLEARFEKQAATARWLADQIRDLRPDWDEMGYYQSVKPRQPAPRGRRPRSAQTETAPSA